MAIGGKLAGFKFATLEYTTQSCIQSWDFQSAINAITYQCNGYDKTASGTKQVAFRITMGLDADTTLLINFMPGTTGLWEGFPAGETTGYIKITSTRGTVISAPLSAPQNGIISMDVEIALDDVTYTTA